MEAMGSGHLSVLPQKNYRSCDERGEKTPDILQLLEDIRIHFEQLKKLRKHYRAALPQLRKLGEGDMDKFLRAYAKLKISVMKKSKSSKLTNTHLKNQDNKDLR